MPLLYTRNVFKNILFIGMVSAFVFTLFACATTNNPNPYRKVDMTIERWQYNLVRSPERWKMGVDAFFLNGGATPTELANRSSAYSPAAISTMMVQAGDFHHISIDGDFQIQIFGTDQPSVYIYGPNAGVRETIVETRDGILCVRQTGRMNPRAMSRVIVRIGVRQLDSLKQMGCGNIEAIQIHSDCLKLYSGPNSTGDIYIEGPHLNVSQITKLGRGSITVFNAQSPELAIVAGGMGAVNVCGNIGIRSIVKTGAADVNIIGANSNCLSINASGVGRVSVSGIVKLDRLIARNHVCVLICSVVSDKLRVFVGDEATVGISGRARTLYLDMTGMGKFAGRSLCTWEAFVKTNESAHANVSASDKLFANATGNSSIYTFGPADALSQFTSDSALIFSFYEYPSCIMPPFKVDARHMRRGRIDKPRPGMRMRAGEG